MPSLRRVLGIAGVAGLAVLVFVVARYRRDYVDFAVYQTAGRRALAAEPLYRAADQHYQFKYLPVFALAMTPFAAVGAETGKAIWFAVSVGALLGFVGRSIDLLPDRRRSVRFLAWVTALLIGKFVVNELVNGQTNLLLGWLLVCALATAQRGRRTAAGALVGVAVFVKPYAVLFLPWIAAALGAAALGAAGAVILAGLALPCAVYGWSGNLAQLAAWSRTLSSTTAENLRFGENISVASMWAKWIGPGEAATMLAAATGLGLLALAAAVYVQRRRVRSPEYLEVGLLLWSIPLLSPQGWGYVLVLGTPAIIALVDRWREMPGSARVLAAVSFALTSFTAYDLLGRALYTRLLDSSLITVAALALAVLFARLRTRSLA